MTSPHNQTKRSQFGLRGLIAVSLTVPVIAGMAAGTFGTALQNVVLNLSLLTATVTLLTVFGALLVSTVARCLPRRSSSLVLSCAVWSVVFLCGFYFVVEDLAPVLTMFRDWNHIVISLLLASTYLVGWSLTWTVAESRRMP